MNGVTTAIVLFIFAALAIPSLVKHRSQFYAALIVTLIVIFLDATAHVAAKSEAYGAFVYFMCGIGQIVAVLLLVLAAGGLSTRDLAGQMGHAIEVIRRGETEKEVIIPLSAAAMKKTPEEDLPLKRNRQTEEDLPRQSYTLDDVPAPAPAPKKPDVGPLPLV